MKERKEAWLSSLDDGKKERRRSGRQGQDRAAAWQGRNPSSSLSPSSPVSPASTYSKRKRRALKAIIHGKRRSGRKMKGGLCCSVSLQKDIRDF